MLREYAAGVDTPLARLPRGYDVFSNTFAVDEGGNVTSVYFDRVQLANREIAHLQDHRQLKPRRRRPDETTSSKPRRRISRL